MNDCVVRPWEALGDLRFGVSRDAVRSLLGDQFRSFKRTPKAKTLTDEYENLGLQLSYDEDDKLEFIEAYPPCMPTYQGIELFGELTLVLRQLEAAGHMLKADDVGYSCEQLGFALFAPMQTIEAVSVYRRGYYD